MDGEVKGRRDRGIVEWVGMIASVGALTLAAVPCYVSQAGPASAAVPEASPAVMPAVAVAAPPQRRVGAVATEADDRVWFNRATGVYHQAGCRFYLTTAKGVLLAPSEAQRVGEACSTCFSPRRPARSRSRSRDVADRVYVLP